MPSALLTPSSVHINKPLTNLARGYTPPLNVAERVFPVVMVVKESDRYFRFNKEELQETGNDENLRANGALANEFTWDVTDTSYLAHEYARRMLVTDRVVRNADVPIQPSQTTTRKLKDLLMIAQERRVQAIAQSTAIFTNTNAASIKWDQSTAIIEQEVDEAKRQILLNAGVIANSMLLSFQAANAVKRWLKAQAQTTYSEWLSKNMLPPVLWGLETIVAEAVRNTANSNQTESLGFIWNDNVLIFHKQPSATITDQSAGYILRARDWQVKTYREEAREGNWHECSVIEDEVTVDPNSGYIVSDVIT